MVGNTYFKYHILVSIAEGGAEGVGGIGGGGAVEHHGALRHTKRPRHNLPLAVRRDAHRAHWLHQRAGLAPVPIRKGETISKVKSYTFPMGNDLWIKLKYFKNRNKFFSHRSCNFPPTMKIYGTVIFLRVCSKVVQIWWRQKPQMMRMYALKA